jgi:rubrerythrin
VLGLPTAIFQLIRAYGGSSPRGRYRGLDVANLKARSGDLHGAAEHYKRILETVEVSAGVRYNLGLALVRSSERDLAEGAFEMAIKDCATYEPAYTQLRLLYKMSRKVNELKALEAKWLLQEPETTESTPSPPLNEAKAVEFQPLTIVDCPWCGTTVAPTPQNECPACRRSLSR